MILPNPNQNQPFDRVTKDAQGNPLYGYRTVDGAEEIVDMRTNQSNMKYHQPERVSRAEDHEHEFRVEDMPKRLFTCRKCDWQIIAIVNQIEETEEGMFINTKQGKFRVV